ncbi:MAG TPA: hypothetical protein VG733_20135 [Chthoniobacteraceae bacterium]|nr:hypothetical protein [Chthoniobacteraceae bacterium]
MTAEEIAAANCALIWELYWGATYSPAIKRRLLEPVFDGLESEDKIGNLIVDVGSGASPVTRLLKAKPGRKWICVDIAADNASSPDELRVRLDAGKVGEPGVLGLRKALIRACLFLGMDPRTAVDREQADTIMFSDILNYVDFRKVLDGFATYLKTGGRMLVINLPMRGSRALFSEKGLKNNNHLYTFLSEHHFEIEYKSFPKRPPGTADESGELIVLVARKCIPPGGRQPNE